MLAGKVYFIQFLEDKRNPCAAGKNKIHDLYLILSNILFSFLTNEVYIYSDQT